MRALFADVRRTFLRPFSLAVLVGAIALAIFLSPPSSLTAPGPPGHLYFTPGQFAVSYEYQGGWVFRFFVFNGTGAPVSGAAVFVAISEGNASVAPPANGSGTTDSAGLATVDVAANDTSGSVDFEVRSPGANAGYQAPIGAVPPGTEVAGPGTISQIGSGPYGLVPKMLVYFPGPTGGAPVGATVVVDANFSEPDSRTVVLSSAPLDAATGVFGPSQAALPKQAARIDFLVVGPGGAVVAHLSVTPPDLEERSYTSTDWGGPLDQLADIWGFAAAVFGVCEGYAAYGRDRGSRSLEPLIALPTTKAGILVRRYLSGLFVLAVAFAAVVLIDLQVDGPNPGQFPPALLLAVFGGLLLESAAFLGLTFLLSHSVRSAGVSVGGGVALATVLTFFLVPLDFVLADEGVTRVSGAAIATLQDATPTHLVAGTVAAYFATLGSASPDGATLQTAFFLPLAFILVVTLVTPVLAALLASYRD